jgi:hypothetical protein
VPQVRREAVKPTSRQAGVIVAGAVLVIACALLAASSGLGPESLASSAMLTPPWTRTPTSIPPGPYLPFVSKQEPPTPTPTSVPPGVHVLSNHSYYVTSWGSLHFVGEVYNNTSNHLEYVRIAANLFNSRGGFVGTDYTYTALDTLPAGDRACFDLLFYEPPDDWAYYQFESPTYYTTDRGLPNLTILNDSGSYQYDGDYEIIGMVRNDHGRRVEYVQPVGTLYNAVGTVVGCEYTYVNSTHLDPGQTSSFKMTFYGRDYADVASYRLQADGDSQ